MIDTPETVLRRAISVAPPKLVEWDEIERRARRPRRSRRRVILVLAVGALAAAIIVLAGGIGRDGRPSELERARAALAAPWPAGEILHVRTRMVSHFDQPEQVSDSWQLTSWPYTRRTVSTFLDGKQSDRTEMSVAADGRGQLYDWRSDSVVETAGVGQDWRPTGVEEASRAGMERWLATVQPENLGASVVDGHQVIGFELTGSQAPGTYRIFLDATTYLPVMSQSFGVGDGELARGYDQHYSWDVLPDTPDNRDLLEVRAQHPGAATASAAGPAWRERAMELGRLFRTTIVPGA